jgi:protein involved in sex pheromone biosynthesis
MKHVLKRRWIPLKIKVGYILLILVLLTGCFGNDDVDDDPNIIKPTTQGEYTLIADFTVSPVRLYHGTYLGSYDAMEIGRRLQQKSKTHFSIEQHYLQEGQILSYDRLISLVRRESDINPQGLNPPTGSTFDIGDGKTFVNDAVVVADIVELNFVGNASDNYALKGISLAIVLNQNVRMTVNGVDTFVTIQTDRLYQFGTDIGRKLESYLRTIPEVGDVPVFITLYSTASADATLPGSFIGEGIFRNRSGQFERNNEKWVILPSTEATTVDATLSSQFATLKSSLQSLLPEAVGVIGKARYIDNEADELKITINMVGKTYTEVSMVTQITAQLLDTFENNDMLIVVEIRSLGTVMAVLERKRDQAKPTVIYVN